MSKKKKKMLWHHQSFNRALKNKYVNKKHLGFNVIQQEEGKQARELTTQFVGLRADQQRGTKAEIKEAASGSGWQLTGQLMQGPW